MTSINEYIYFIFLIKLNINKVKQIQIYCDTTDFKNS